MALRLEYHMPKNETQLRELQDYLYHETKQAILRNERPKFKDLLEVISSETTILTAIHNIKSNQGSQTPGSDGQIMQDILTKDYRQIIQTVKEQLKHYKPKPIRRVWIPKPGKAEKRPLGIPNIIDRVIQECIRIIIEPIMEAQFFNHSYGFRPMRDAHMALERVTDIVHKTGYHWIIEGVISKFFDNINHTKLIKKLWHMGIRDRRVLMIIKAMLKAGIMDEVKESPLGTPQGGIISPLLANVYLNSFDWWVAKAWEEKKTKTKYSNQANKIRALKKTNLKPAYLIRYADDWVLITNTKENAEKWKYQIKKQLKDRFKLELSEEKTFITNIKEKPIKFLGFTYKVIPGKSRKGYITKTRPDPDKLKTKTKEIRKEIKQLRKISDKNQLIHQINIINSKIRGLGQYYKIATWVNIDLSKYAKTLLYAAYKALAKYGGKWTPANQVNNLTTIHEEYTKQIPAIEHKDMKLGITSLAFIKWKKCTLKNPKETPYTPEGRKLNLERTQKKPPGVRADELLSLHLSELIATERTNPIYNFEYFLNRAYAYNRDKGKCKICGKPVENHNLHIHHIQKDLPMEQINKVQNLATVHKPCHELIHHDADITGLDRKTQARIIKYRERLNELTEVV